MTLIIIALAKKRSDLFFLQCRSAEDFLAFGQIVLGALVFYHFRLFSTFLLWWRAQLCFDKIILVLSYK